MVAVERNPVLLVAKPAATTATAAAIRAMVAATHALHIHVLNFILVRLLHGHRRKTPPSPLLPGLLPGLEDCSRRAPCP
jgi:hypothetical protein